MGNENRVNHQARLISALKEAGIKGTPITIEFDPKIEKVVKDYVMMIEDGHKKAAESTLVFDSSLAPTLHPSNS